ncbi:MAG: polyketide synthase [Elusimicrobia bacterium]|nr:polyketide synthase [Elusimicrobiota bacterium]
MKRPSPPSGTCAGSGCAGGAGAVAIVGIGGVFPGTPGLDGFWSDIAGRRSAARDVPAGRWLIPPEEAYNPAVGAPDKVYSKRGCFVEGFELQGEGLQLEESFIKGLDRVFHFALHAGRMAFRDAVTEGKLDRRRVGVVLGNIALPTDLFSAFCRGVLAGGLSRRIPSLGLSPAPEVSAVNRFAAGLPAAVLARGLGLGGGAYTLDAACASSLYALKLAVDELMEGRADAMLTGGLSRPDCLYTQMGFSQLRALSASGRCSAFDESADGLLVGEGAGLFLLKRLEDAESAGDKVYAVIRGIGLSNDIDGSLLAPEGGGQLRALRAAYAEADWGPAEVDLIECHATGTPVGDAVEFSSLQTLWGSGGWRPGACVLGSVKSNIGHLLTGAGAAGLMKVLLALKNRTLPPSANFARPGPRIPLEGSAFRVLTAAEPWQPCAEGVTRKAAVSSFGFGGINAHVLLEEHAPGPRLAATPFLKPPGTAGPPAWTPRRPKVPGPKAQAPSAVAIVGMEARFGDLPGLRAFQEARPLSASRPRSSRRCSPSRS